MEKDIKEEINNYNKLTEIIFILDKGLMYRSFILNLYK